MNNPAQKINNDRDSELKKIKGKALALTSTGFGYWENPKGDKFKWDEHRREFVRSNASDGGSLDPKQYFMDRFGMTDSGNNKLNDKHGQVWKLNFTARKLQKISSPMDKKPKKTK